jgi:hypothetical protein
MSDAEKDVLRQRVKQRVLDDKSKGLSYAKVAYGDASSEYDVFQRLYDAFNDGDVDDEKLYEEVQVSISQTFYARNLLMLQNKLVHFLKHCMGACTVRN